MKPFAWDEEKNLWLQRERGISFEEAVLSIHSGGLLDVIKHPNQKIYRGQYIYVIDIEGYAYGVPYIEDKEVIFLKTMFPSRKYTKRYLREEKK